MEDPNAAQEYTPDRPPVLYVPCKRAQDNVFVAMNTTPEGERVLLAYTALDRLYDGFGKADWLLMDWEALADLDEAQPYDIIIKDLIVPDEERGRIFDAV